MSRLPRLRSSSPTTEPLTLLGSTMPSTITTRSLKRKAIIEEDEEDEGQDQPRKMAAVGSSRPNRPLQPTRTAMNGARSTSGSGPSIPKPLTKPCAPAITRPKTRGTSAPPTRPSTKPTSSTGRAGPTRTTSGSFSRNGKSSLDADMAAEKTKVAELQANHALLSQQLAAARTQELNQRRELVGFSDELEQMRKKHQREIGDLEMEVKRREREVREVGEELRMCKENLDRERENVTTLKSMISQQTTEHVQLTTQVQALHAQNTTLQNQNDAFARTLEEYKLQSETNDRRIAELKKEILESEIVRRKLHNMVQELKGNIRVFCRVRPILPSDLPSPTSSPTHTSGSSTSPSPSSVAADISYPDDDKSIQLFSSTLTATGNTRSETHSFTFDRVFDPSATQKDVFEEIELLAQSCMDGYNVCIFAYGQTGSGKSYTMEGGGSEQSAGMIPRAVEQVFRVKEEMRSKGWEYTVEGQFLEIYNETINDLLSPSTSVESTKKHEIKHDPKTNTTRVTDLTIISLTSPSQTKTLLALANKRRSVAATLVNERSSRSHSVFTLRISGVNIGFPQGGVEGTGERCEGCLNLVDLAGSERLNVSFANGPGVAGPGKERVKETQNINKSLSALGDVIAALGEKGEKEKGSGGAGGGQAVHVPYRNSKLTYLLQNSLSGNSKTLMFLNLSPLACHLGESLTSLRFATKVNNTQIGSAKKQPTRSS